MGRVSITAIAAIAAMAALGSVAAVRGQSTPAQPKLAAVTAFPAPGTYSNTIGVALRAADGAEIHYTWDGTTPTSASPRIEAGQVLFVSGVYDGDRGLQTGYTLRAVATKPGRAESDPVTFGYTVARRDRTQYASEEVAPGVRMIRDSDNDKMFLVRGTNAYALIDTGMGRGDLRAYVERFTGGLPVVVILTHMHGDHIGQANRFIDASREYVGAADREAVTRSLERQGASAATIAAHLTPVEDGALVDLGDRKLEIYAVPGHTPGSIAILDPASGNLFTGDTFGNNSPLPPDVMWMQRYDGSLDVYLANVRTTRAQLDGRVKRIFTGHNDHPLQGTRFLDNLQTAVQRGLDQGEAALMPSWRPSGIVQLVEGDRFADPDWFGVNVNRATFMPAPPDQVAGLTALLAVGASLSPRFSPRVHDYVAVRTGRTAPTFTAIPTSTRSRALQIAGRKAPAGVPVRIDPAARATLIDVVAPDGKTRATYRVRWTR